MFAQTPQYRPEIARVAEETVLNLKQLESRIDVLKNDLAALCTVLGHPEAARIAVTPPSWLGITPHGSYGNVGIQGLGTLGSFGATPFQGSLPFASPQAVPWTQGVSPVPPWTQGVSPYSAPISPFVQGISPFAQGISPFAQGINPYTQGVSPYGQSFGMGTVPYGTYGNLPSQYPPIR